MWLDGFFTHKILQDIVATVITFTVALVWLRGIDALAHRGILEQKLSRKIIHIGTGPLFVLCWNLFSAEPWARFAAALVPLAITIQFVAVGLGWIQDEGAVKAMTRHGDPKEILRGPLYYGIVFVACTLVFWRHSPVGIVALMLMCGGDGLADVIGRRFGRAKLPFSTTKSWAGSAAMFAGGFAFAFGYVALFNALGNFQPPLIESSLGSLLRVAGRVAAITLGATLVEALPLQDIDNVTLTLTAIGLGMWWL